MNDAIAAALAKVEYNRPGFRVHFSPERGAGPHHYGVFVERADAEALVSALKADGDPRPLTIKAFEYARSAQR